MASALDIITAAFRKLGVAAEDRALTADQVAVGLDELNRMMHAWKLRGVDVSHTDLAASDTFPLAPEYEEGTVFMLASRLSPNYTVPAGFDPDEWFRAMQAAYVAPGTATIPNMLLRMPSQYRSGGRVR